MGHPAGDHVLLETAQRITSLVLPEDLVARIGGDEFVVLLFVSDCSERPERLADMLRRVLAKPTIFQGKECRFGASIGLARTPLSGEDQLLTNSDVALFKAKRSGRGRVGVFDSSDLEEVRNTKTLADDVLRGIENCEFVPFYQPQVDAQTHEIVGIEALARWRHPTKGILPPAKFLHVASDLNVAAEIDKMIFETAVNECSDAFSSLPKVPSISFNVSAKRVSEGDYDGIQKHIQHYPGKICFELLETIFLEEEDEAFLFRLDRFRELGIDIEIDDFGSGRASVVALQRIGPDRLKIDRRLIMPIAESFKARRLIRSMIDIGRALEIGVVAEGVETGEQAAILAQLGCETLQGYHFAMPMSFTDMIDQLTSWEGRRNHSL